MSRMRVKQSGAAKKVATQKVPATQLVAASHTRSPGYVTSPSNVAAVGAHTYAHREGKGPAHGYGSADVRRSPHAGKPARGIAADERGGAPGKDIPATYYEPPVLETERDI